MMKAFWSIPNSAWVLTFGTDLYSATLVTLEKSGAMFWRKKKDLKADLKAHGLGLDKDNKVYTLPFTHCVKCDWRLEDKAEIERGTCAHCFSE